MISVMAAVMAVQAALIYQVQNSTPISHSAGIAAAAMLFVFQGAFTIGFQATVWVYPAEILPLRLRQRGSSISTASNWICNYLIVQITPPAIENIGWKTYIIFAVLNALWVPIIWVWFPETKGLELEDVDRLFGGEEFIEPDRREGDEEGRRDFGHNGGGKGMFSTTQYPHTNMQDVLDLDDKGVVVRPESRPTTIQGHDPDQAEEEGLSGEDIRENV